MNDMKREETNGLLPADEDPVVHRMLSGLPPAEPLGSLSDRVLSQVRRPPPAWVRTLKGSVRGLSDSGRIWLVIGGLAVGSLLPVAVAAAGVAVFAPTLANAFDAAVTELLPLGWMYARGQVMSLVETGVTWVDALALPPRVWLTLALATVVGLAGCGWGLHRTMTPRAARR
jgi:hypothetical protein